MLLHIEKDLLLKVIQHAAKVHQANLSVHNVGTAGVPFLQLLRSFDIVCPENGVTGVQKAVLYNHLLMLSQSHNSHSQENNGAIGTDWEHRLDEYCEKGPPLSLNDLAASSSSLGLTDRFPSRQPASNSASPLFRDSTPNPQSIESDGVARSPVKPLSRSSAAQSRAHVPRLSVEDLLDFGEETAIPDGDYDVEVHLTRSPRSRTLQNHEPNRGAPLPFSHPNTVSFAAEPFTLSGDSHHENVFPPRPKSPAELFTQQYAARKTSVDNSNLTGLSQRLRVSRSEQDFILRDTLSDASEEVVSDVHATRLSAPPRPILHGKEEDANDVPEEMELFYRRFFSSSTGNDAQVDVPFERSAYANHLTLSMFFLRWRKTACELSKQRREHAELQRKQSAADTLRSATVKRSFFRQWLSRTLDTKARVVAMNSLVDKRVVRSNFEALREYATECREGRQLRGMFSTVKVFRSWKEFAKRQKILNRVGSHISKSYRLGLVTHCLFHWRDMAVARANLRDKEKVLTRTVHHRHLLMAFSLWRDATWMKEAARMFRRHNLLRNATQVWFEHSSRSALHKRMKETARLFRLRSLLRKPFRVMYDSVAEKYGTIRAYRLRREQILRINFRELRHYVVQKRKADAHFKKVTTTKITNEWHAVSSKMKKLCERTRGVFKRRYDTLMGSALTRWKTVAREDTIELFRNGVADRHFQRKEKGLALDAWKHFMRLRKSHQERNDRAKLFLTLHSGRQGVHRWRVFVHQKKRDKRKTAALVQINRKSALSSAWNIWKTELKRVASLEALQKQFQEYQLHSQQVLCFRSWVDTTAKRKEGVRSVFLRKFFASWRSAHSLRARAKNLAKTVELVSKSIVLKRFRNLVQHSSEIEESAEAQWQALITKRKREAVTAFLHNARHKQLHQSRQSDLEHMRKTRVFRVWKAATRQLRVMHTLDTVQDKLTLAIGFKRWTEAFSEALSVLHLSVQLRMRTRFKQWRWRVSAMKEDRRLAAQLQQQREMKWKQKVFDSWSHQYQFAVSSKRIELKVKDVREIHLVRPLFQKWSKMALERVRIKTCQRAVLASRRQRMSRKIWDRWQSAAQLRMKEKRFRLRVCLSKFRNQCLQKRLRKRKVLNGRRRVQKLRLRKFIATWKSRAASRVAWRSMRNTADNLMKLKTVKKALPKWVAFTSQSRNTNTKMLAAREHYHRSVIHHWKSLTKKTQEKQQYLKEVDAIHHEQLKQHAWSMWIKAIKQKRQDERNTIEADHHYNRQLQFRFFNTWYGRWHDAEREYEAIQTADDHNNFITVRRALVAWSIYLEQRRQKSKEKERADSHYHRSLTRRMFSPWERETALTIRAENHCKRKTINFWKKQVPELRKKNQDLVHEKRFRRHHLQHQYFEIWLHTFRVRHIFSLSVRGTIHRNNRLALNKWIWFTRHRAHMRLCAEKIRESRKLRLFKAAFLQLKQNRDRNKACHSIVGTLQSMTIRFFFKKMAFKSEREVRREEGIRQVCRHIDDSFSSAYVAACFHSLREHAVRQRREKWAIHHVGLMQTDRLFNLWKESLRKKREFDYCSSVIQASTRTNLLRQSMAQWLKLSVASCHFKKRSKAVAFRGFQSVVAREKAAEDLRLRNLQRFATRHLHAWKDALTVVRLRHQRARRLALRAGLQWKQMAGEAKYNKILHEQLPLLRMKRVFGAWRLWAWEESSLREEADAFEEKLHLSGKFTPKSQGTAALEEKQPQTAGKEKRVVDHAHAPPQVTPSSPPRTLQVRSSDPQSRTHTRTLSQMHPQQHPRVSPRHQSLSPGMLRRAQSLGGSSHDTHTAALDRQQSVSSVLSRKSSVSIINVFPADNEDNLPVTVVTSPRGKSPRRGGRSQPPPLDTVNVKDIEAPTFDPNHVTSPQSARLTGQGYGGTSSRSLHRKTLSTTTVDSGQSLSPEHWGGDGEREEKKPVSAGGKASLAQTLESPLTGGAVERGKLTARSGSGQNHRRTMSARPLDLGLLNTTDDGSALRMKHSSHSPRARLGRQQTVPLLSKPPFRRRGSTTALPLTFESSPVVAAEPSVSGGEGASDSSSLVNHQNMMKSRRTASLKRRVSMSEISFPQEVESPSSVVVNKTTTRPMGHSRTMSADFSLISGQSNLSFVKDSDDAQSMERPRVDTFVPSRRNVVKTRLQPQTEYVPHGISVALPMGLIEATSPNVVDNDNDALPPWAQQGGEPREKAKKYMHRWTVWRQQEAFRLWRSNVRKLKQEKHMNTCADIAHKRLLQSLFVQRLKKLVNHRRQLRSADLLRRLNLLTTPFVVWFSAYRVRRNAEAEEQAAMVHWARRLVGSHFDSWRQYAERSKALDEAASKFAPASRMHMLRHAVGRLRSWKARKAKRQQLNSAAVCFANTSLMKRVFARVRANVDLNKLRVAALQRYVDRKDMFKCLGAVQQWRRYADWQRQIQVHGLQIFVNRQWRLIHQSFYHWRGAYERQINIKVEVSGFYADRVQRSFFKMWKQNVCERKRERALSAMATSSFVAMVDSRVSKMVLFWQKWASSRRTNRMILNRYNVNHRLPRVFRAWSAYVYSRRQARRHYGRSVMQRFFQQWRQATQDVQDERQMELVATVDLTVGRLSRALQLWNRVRKDSERLRRIARVLLLRRGGIPLGGESSPLIPCMTVVPSKSKAVVTPLQETVPFDATVYHVEAVCVIYDLDLTAVEAIRRRREAATIVEVAEEDRLPSVLDHELKLSDGDSDSSSTPSLRWTRGQQIRASVRRLRDSTASRVQEYSTQRPISTSIPREVQIVTKVVDDDTISPIIAFPKVISMRFLFQTWRQLLARRIAERGRRERFQKKWALAHMRRILSIQGRSRYELDQASRHFRLAATSKFVNFVRARLDRRRRLALIQERVMELRTNRMEERSFEMWRREAGYEPRLVYLEKKLQDNLKLSRRRLILHRWIHAVEERELEREAITHFRSKHLAQSVSHWLVYTRDSMFYRMAATQLRATVRSNRIHTILAAWSSAARRQRQVRKSLETIEERARQRNLAPLFQHWQKLCKNRRKLEKGVARWRLWAARVSKLRTCLKSHETRSVKVALVGWHNATRAERFHEQVLYQGLFIQLRGLAAARKMREWRLRQCMLSWRARSECLRSLRERVQKRVVRTHFKAMTRKFNLIQRQRFSAQHLQAEMKVRQKLKLLRAWRDATSESIRMSNLAIVADEHYKPRALVRLMKQWSVFVQVHKEEKVLLMQRAIEWDELRLQNSCWRRMVSYTHACQDYRDETVHRATVFFSKHYAHRQTKTAFSVWFKATVVRVQAKKVFHMHNRNLMRKALSVWLKKLGAAAVASKRRTAANVSHRLSVLGHMFSNWKSYVRARNWNAYSELRSPRSISSPRGRDGLPMSPRAVESISRLTNFFVGSATSHRDDKKSASAQSSGGKGRTRRPPSVVKALSSSSSSDTEWGAEPAVEIKVDPVSPSSSSSTSSKHEDSPMVVGDLEDHAEMDSPYRWQAQPASPLSSSSSDDEHEQGSRKSPPHLRLPPFSP